MGEHDYSRHYKLRVIEVLKPDITQFSPYPVLDVTAPNEGIELLVYTALTRLFPIEGMVFKGILMELVHLIDSQTRFKPNVLEQGIKNMAYYNVLTSNEQYFEPTPTFQNKFS